MGWYAVKTLTQSSIQVMPNKYFFDESLMLVEAESSKDAEKMAKKHIKAFHLPVYENPQGQVVKWKFVKVIEIIDLCEDHIFSGIQVYSQLFEADSPDVQAF